MSATVVTTRRTSAKADETTHAVARHPGTLPRRSTPRGGAALDPTYREVGPFTFVAVTGPNRRLARGLGFHEAAPYGDMMLAGAWGLVEGVRLLTEE